MKKYLLALCLFVWAIHAKAIQADTTVYHSRLLPCEINIPVTGAPDPFFAPWPQYPGGIRSFYTYLSAHIQAPSKSIKNEMQGRVILSVIIEKDGSISNVHVEQGISAELDNEAIRLVNLSPKWEPGLLNGKAVRVQRTLPMNFSLASNKVSF